MFLSTCTGVSNNELLTWLYPPPNPSAEFYSRLAISFESNKLKLNSTQHVLFPQQYFFNDVSSVQCDLFLVLTLEQVLCDKDRTPKKVPHVTGLQHACSPWTLAIPQHNTGRTNNYLSQLQQAQVMGHLERRVLEVNRKRIKVVKPGSKTSFPSTELRGTYAPPFHVSYSFKFSR